MDVLVELHWHNCIHICSLFHQQFQLIHNQSATTFWEMLVGLDRNGFRGAAGYLGTPWVFRQPAILCRALSFCFIPEAFCLFFFICSFSSSFPPQTGQRTPLSLPWWIDESEINCTGLLKEATCASWSRIGFTVSAHSGLFLAQPFKPGRPSFGLVKLKHVVIIYTNITIQNMLACYKTWGVLLHRAPFCFPVQLWVHYQPTSLALN